MENVILPNENFADMVIEQRPPHGVYVKADDAGRITAINSSAFLPDTDGWMMIDQGFGDEYHHAQGNYLPAPLMDERGIYQWMVVSENELGDHEAFKAFITDNAKSWYVCKRTQEEIDADYIPPVPAPDGSMESLAAEVAALKESNAQLQEALDLLLSGEVE